MKHEILSYLPPDHPWANRIHYFDTTDSTNTQAKKMAAAGAPHGTVLIAGHQTGGRGRMGRSFHSPAGLGIYLSVILRPNCDPQDLMHLTCATGCSMCDAVEHTAGFRPGIKWINDLVFGGKKLGGILVEMSLAASGQVHYAVVGIGINCSHMPTNFPPEIRSIASSLAMVAGGSISSAQLAAAMVDALFRMDQQLLTGKRNIMARYRKDCVTIGQEVKVMSDPPKPGVALDVDDDGALIVRFTDGQIDTISAGEVSVRGMYGYV